MQSPDSNTGTANPVKHPDAAEWMAFLYQETGPARRRELESHLTQCAACARQITAWRADLKTLDEWKLPAIRHAQPQWLPALKWAAAALVLGAGFLMGRQTSPTAAELAALKASVTQLTQTIQSGRSLNLTNSVNVASAAAKAQTLRLLSEYSQLQENQRAADQRTVALTLKDFDTRLARLRTELETVAVNTEVGFEQTHDNLSRLASFSAPAKNSAAQTSTNPN
jgi:hypothetical protein